MPTSSTRVIRRRVGEPDVFAKTGQPVRCEPPAVAKTATPNRAERELASAMLRELRAGKGHMVRGGSSAIQGGPFRGHIRW